MEQMLISYSKLEERDAVPSHPVFVQESPISHLPAELVLRIVEFAADDRPYALPIFASHVCSQWRKLTLDSPTLWSTMYINNFLSNNPKRQLECASTFVVRSPKCELAVFVDLCPLVSRDEGLSLLFAIAMFISQHSERIRHLSIRYTPNFQVMGVSVMVPLGLVQLLEVFSMKCVPGDFFEESSVLSTPPNQIVIPSAFQIPDDGSENDSQPAESFPNLAELTLKCTAVLWFRFAPRSLQCLALHDLTSAAPTWTDLFHVLKANASTLVSLDLDKVYPVHLRTHPPFEMPVLRKLRIAYTNPAFLYSFSPVCLVPHLQELRIIDEGGEGVNAQDLTQSNAFARAMLYMPLHKIRYLHLAGIAPMPDSAVMAKPDDGLVPIAFIRRLCSLERLKLTNPDRCTLAALNYFLPRLCEQGMEDAAELAPTQVVPLLSRLSLRMISLERFSAFLWDRAVMTARGPAPFRQLDVVDIRFNSEEPEVDPARFAVTKRNIVDCLEILEPRRRSRLRLM